MVTVSWFNSSWGPLLFPSPCFFSLLCPVCSFIQSNSRLNGTVIIAVQFTIPFAFQGIQVVLLAHKTVSLQDKCFFLFPQKCAANLDDTSVIKLVRGVRYQGPADVWCRDTQFESRSIKTVLARRRWGTQDEQSSEPHCSKYLIWINTKQIWRLTFCPLR